MADFQLTTKRCKLCLQLFDNAPPGTTETCPHCRQAFSISSDEKEALWKKQLDLFVNFNDEKDSGSADALVLWSGGSDSTLALYETKYTLGFNVIAFKYECSFERQEVQKAAQEFVHKHNIPLITLKSDMRAIFSQCHRDDKNLSDKTIVDFPWDQFHASGHRSPVWKGADIIAKLLGIKRVISGNNLIDFSVYQEQSAPQTMGQHFIKNNMRWLTPMRVLMVHNEYLLLNLPLALGYTKQKKIRKLKEIGYQLPESCDATTESDTELGLLFAAVTRKVYPHSMYSPYASAYQEFLSGYISREQWLEELIKANNFSTADVQRAMKRLRELLFQSTLNHDMSISANTQFQEAMHGFDYKSALNKIVTLLYQNQLIQLSEQLLSIGKPGAVTAHAKKAVELCPNDKAGYLLLGAALEECGKHQEAIKVYQEAVAKVPDTPELRLKLDQAIA